jgi:hypothetical protein
VLALPGEGQAERFPTRRRWRGRCVKTTSSILWAREAGEEAQGMTREEAAG